MDNNITSLKELFIVFTVKWNAIECKPNCCCFGAKGVEECDECEYDLYINESEKDEINGLLLLLFLLFLSITMLIISSPHDIECNNFECKPIELRVHAIAQTVPHSFRFSSCILINATFDHGLVITMAFTCCIQHRKIKHNKVITVCIEQKPHWIPNFLHTRTWMHSCRWIYLVVVCIQISVSVLQSCVYANELIEDSFLASQPFQRKKNWHCQEIQWRHATIIVGSENEEINKMNLFS